MTMKANLLSTGDLLFFLEKDSKKYVGCSFVFLEWTVMFTLKIRRVKI